MLGQYIAGQPHARERMVLTVRKFGDGCVVENQGWKAAVNGIHQQRGTEKGGGVHSQDVLSMASLI